MYKKAILLHSETIDEIVEEGMKTSASELAAQAAFFLGMTHQDVSCDNLSTCTTCYS